MISCPTHYFKVRPEPHLSVNINTFEHSEHKLHYVRCCYKHEHCECLYNLSPNIFVSFLLYLDIFTLFNIIDCC